MADEYLSVKDIENYQHYKNRCPPWIKLHLLNTVRDYDFSCLQDASKAHLILIWLLASQLSNRIPNDPEWIKGQTGMRTKPNLNLLIEKGFLVLEQNANRTLAKRYQSATPEAEAEAEAEAEPPIAPQGERSKKRYRNVTETVQRRGEENRVDKTPPMVPPRGPTALTNSGNSTLGRSASKLLSGHGKSSNQTSASNP